MADRKKKKKKTTSFFAGFGRAICSRSFPGFWPIGVKLLPYSIINKTRKLRPKTKQNTKK